MIQTVFSSSLIPLLMVTGSSILLIGMKISANLVNVLSSECWEWEHIFDKKSYTYVLRMRIGMIAVPCTRFRCFLRPAIVALLPSRCILVISADCRAFPTILALFLLFFSFRLHTCEWRTWISSYTLLILLLWCEFGMDEYGTLFGMHGARHASLLL